MSALSLPRARRRQRRPFTEKEWAALLCIGALVFSWAMQALAYTLLRGRWPVYAAAVGTIFVGWWWLDDEICGPYEIRGPIGAVFILKHWWQG